MILRRIAGPWVAMLLDAVAASGAFVVAYWLRFALPFFPDRLIPPLDDYLRFAVVVGIVSGVSLHGTGTYRVGWASLGSAPVSRILRGSLVAFLLIAAISFLTHGGWSGVAEQNISRLVIAITWMLAIGFFLFWRLVSLGVARLLNRRGWGITKVLVLGVNPTSVRFCEAVATRSLSSFQVTGFVAQDSASVVTPNGVPVVGTVDDLPDLLRAGEVQEVVAALDNPSSDLLARLLKVCSQSGVAFRSIPDVPSLLLSPVQVEEVAGFPLFAPEDGLAQVRSRAIKRALDLVISSSLLLMLLPLGVVLTCIIRWSSKGSALFVQERVGKDGRVFKMYKFRSMVENAEERLEEIRSQNKGADPMLRLRDDPRVTTVGRFMRSLSLDEMPQLINVLRGEMSLVGPRPHVAYEVAEYSEWHLRRHDVLPGITGLTQVSGRRSLSLDDMIKLDIYYIENWSVWLDVQIMFQTIPIVLSRHGAY